MRPMKKIILALGLLAAAGVVAQTLPDRKDVVSWKLLAQVELVKVKDRYQPQFSSLYIATPSSQRSMSNAS